MNQFGNMKGLGTGLFPPVIKNIVIINVVIFIVQYLFLEALAVPGYTSARLFMNSFLALQPISDFNSPMLLLLPLQMITYQFLHGGFSHLLFNMYGLWLFGSDVERNMGSKKFLTFYLLAGVGAGIVHLLITPLLGETSSVIGASGSIYGVMFAFAFSNPNRTLMVFPFFIPIKAKYLIMLWGGMDLITGLRGADGVAHFAHLGGFLVGWLLLKYGDQLGIFEMFGNIGGSNKKRGSSMDAFRDVPYEKQANIHKVSWSKKTEVHEEPTTSYSENLKQYNIDGEVVTQDTIDMILDKISESGYQNLTDKEKYILNELSKKL